MRHRIVVTDGSERSALATVRSLGRAGHEPVVCSGDGRSLAGASRFCLADERVPDALRAEGAFLDGLLEVCSRWRPSALIPMTDASNVAILPARDRFGDVRILAPDRDSFERISDKHELSEVARDLGIAVPLSLDLGSAAELDESTTASLTFPVAIKAARSVAGVEGERVRTGVAYATTARELVRILSEWPSAAFPVLVQRKIEGPGIGIFLLRWEGRTLAAAGHRRIREKPPTGGVSVYREAVEPDPELLDRCERLLDAFDWRGVAMIELKRCSRTGVPYLMEVNGRLWGSLQLAIDAGIDFPALLVATELDEPRTPPRPCRWGVRCRWFWGDVDHTLALLRGASRPGPVECLRAVMRLLRPSTPRDRLEVLRASDLRPFLRETSQWFGGVLTSVRARRREAQSLRHELDPRAGSSEVDRG